VITKASVDLKARTAAEAAKKAKADEAAATGAHDDAGAKADAIPANGPGKQAAESEARDKKDAKDKASLRRRRPKGGEPSPQRMISRDGTESGPAGSGSSQHLRNLTAHIG
jgi:membrane protein involved in colicin uptake